MYYVFEQETCVIVRIKICVKLYCYVLQFHHKEFCMKHRVKKIKRHNEHMVGDEMQTVKTLRILLQRWAPTD